MRKRQPRIREAVGLFDNMAALQEAVSDLEIRTFPRDSISVMGGDREMKRVFGAPAVSPAKAADNPATPRQPVVRREERAIGAGALIGLGVYVGVMAAILLAGKVSAATAAPIALGGLGGGAAGALLAALLRDYFDRNIAAQLKKGGLLLWVRTADRKHERLARAILKARGARHVRIQEMLY